jgi:hypothetical protein
MRTAAWTTAGGAALGLALVLGLAIGLAALALYRRELRGRRGALAASLPLLRAAAVALMALLLLEPALLDRRERARKGRVLFLLDRSESFSRGDPAMEPARKAALLEDLGLLALPGGASSEEWTRSPAARRAQAEIDALSRWQRAERRLLDPEHGIVAALRGAQELEFALMTRGGFERLSLPEAGSSGAVFGLPELESLWSAFPKRFFPWSDLAGPLSALAGRESDLPDAVVLISDGRHTEKEPVEDAVRALRRRGVAIHAVGAGSSAEPVDVAVHEVRAPLVVHVEDGLAATLVLKARLGRRAAVRAVIELAHANGAALSPRKEIWSGDIPLEASAEQLLVEHALTLPPGSLPEGRSECVVRIEPLPEEGSSANNQRSFIVLVQRRYPAVLVIDGRPRWEARYLKNLLRRDAKARLAFVVGGVDEGRDGLPRGEGDESLPASREALAEFDAVVLGDVPRAWLEDGDLEALAEWVAREGGGLVLVAGRHHHLAAYRDSPLGPLFPVELLPGIAAGLTQLRLTPAGEALPSLRLTADAGENAELWKLFWPQTWHQPARALPGGEVLVETDGAAPAPVLARRRFGAGQVLYLGIDETWRWRQRLGDRFHRPFWLQLLESVRRRDFIAGGPEFSLETDAAVYRPLSRPRIEVGVRGPAASAADLRIAAEIHGAAGVKHVVALERQAGREGLFAGAGPALEPGRYRVRATLDGAATASPLELPILVEAEISLEDLHASWNEPLLRAVADLGGGRYLREEDLDLLPPLLEPLRRVEVEEWRWELSRSPWWLGAIVALFTIEWVLRKRAGLL